MSKSLQDKVIIVTGAGRGIGREIALLCAAEGAKVVVNDPGGASDGAGSNAAPAEEVVEEIKKRGGTAVANFESVAEAIPASKIVKTATDHFGRLDGVVNNAGILRDMIFHKMSVEAFEAVIKVHLMGSFYVSHAAARIFREQESGSFVHFTSTSGLIGNFGQANYAAAKLGIVGLSKSIALDMGRFNVRSNCVSPFAWTRMIGTIPTETEAEKARGRKDQADGAGEDRAALRLSDLRFRQGRHRPDLWRAHERDLPVQPEPSDPLGAAERRLDAAIDRGTRHAGAEGLVLQARPFRRHLHLGSRLAAFPAFLPCDLRLSCPEIAPVYA
ncbi:NAD(P)-dependent dehydrogenase (short-subunit alcohol dehydrogenase family) [Bradyrhizobium ottawaense]